MVRSFMVVVNENLIVVSPVFGVEAYKKHTSPQPQANVSSRISTNTLMPFANRQRIENVVELVISMIT